MIESRLAFLFFGINLSAVGKNWVANREFMMGIAVDVSRKSDLLPWLAVHVSPYPHPDHVTQVPTSQFCLVFAVKRHNVWRDGGDDRGLSMERKRRCSCEVSVRRTWRCWVWLSDSQSSSSSMEAFGKCLPMVRCDRMRKRKRLECQSYWKQYKFEKALLSLQFMDYE